MNYKVLLVIICLLFLGSSSLAQNNKKAEEVENLGGESIKVEAELVSVPVIVSDPTGRYITDLTPEDFVAYEDEVKQNIEFFAVEATPFYATLIIDTSSSVSVSFGKIKDASLELLNNLRDEDQIAAIGFSNNVYPLTDKFTRDKNTLSTRLSMLRSGSTTSLYDAVYIAAHDVLKKITGRKAVILLTDGFDNTSSFSAQKAIKEMVESGAIVYVIRYPSGNPENSKLDFINELVEATAGVRFESTKIDIKQSMQKIAEELRHVYTIGYYPSNPLEIGGYRNIKLTIKDNPNVAIRYKKAYDATSFADIKKEPVYLAKSDLTTNYKGSPSFSLESKKDISSGLGIISKTIDATPYYDKRIRLTAYLKTKNVQSRAGMWLKVDDQKGQTIVSDTMDNRLIRDTQGWSKYECVLDVDQRSKTISYGILLDSVGKIWISSPKIEVVDKTIPSTATDSWQKYKISETYNNIGFQ